MKKFLVLSSAIVILIAVSCSRKSVPQGSTATTTSKTATSYTTAISSVIQAKCSPCHIPSAGGNKEALDTYDGVKNHIDDIIRRIELSPGERGFMPMRGQKLSDDEINAFKKWKEDGLAK